MALALGNSNPLNPSSGGTSNWFGQNSPLYSLFGHRWSNAIVPMTAAEQLQQDQEGQRYSQGKIEQAYDSPERQQQYQDYMTSLKGLYTGQVDQQQQIAARNLKFSDARSGHTGGSAAADAGGMLQKDYQGGLLTAADTARTGTDSLIAADNAAKNNAIGMSNYGSNVGQASTAGLGSTLNNINANVNATNAGSLGNMFSDLGNVYQQHKAQAAANYSPYASVAQPTSSQW